MTLFVQLYESNTAAVKSEIATFFKHSRMASCSATRTTVAVTISCSSATRDDEDRRRRDRGAIGATAVRDRCAVAARDRFNSATELFSTFAGNEPMLRPWLADAQINRDRNLRLQFLAGMSLNMYDQAGIYSQMLQYRKYPDGLFTGTPERLSQIRMATGGGF